MTKAQWLAKHRERVRRTLAYQKAQALKADEGLIVVAPFLPSPLVERLSGEGFASKVERGQGADWLVYFWREVA